MVDDDDVPEFIIFVVPETLTDKSVVYNIVLGELKFSATDEDAAKEFAEGLEQLIEDHTTNSAGIVYED
jgi:hypothetical protein